MDPRAQILAQVDRFLAEHRMSESRFGRCAVKNHKLLPRLRLGGNVTLRTLRRIEAFMHEFSANGGQACASARSGRLPPGT